MPRKKVNKEISLQTVMNLSYIIIGLLLVVIAGLIVLFSEIG